MPQLPITVSIVFILTTLLTLYFFLKASGWNKVLAIGILLWSATLAMASQTGFFTVYDAMPPRFVIVILPPLFFALLLFFTEGGRRFMDQLNIKTLTILHLVRVPVELVLFWLFVHKTIPQVMTFEGRNFDILSGITAPVIYYLVFIRNTLGLRALLTWNIACFGLLLLIVAHAILAAPTPMQQLAFDQPNIAVFYFPFIWLAGVVVPVCYLSHLVVIRRILKERKASSPNLLTA